MLMFLRHLARLAFALSMFSTTSCAPPELCAEGAEPTIEPTTFPIAHAHNDYEHERPLDDALAARFHSVEVDVWFRDGDLQVSHDAFSSKGTLDALYLLPLERVLLDRDSVLGDGAEFTLWIDLKEGGAEMQRVLAETLDAREYLTRFDDEGVAAQGPVTVILTGDAAAKTALVEDTPAPRPFARDSNALSLDDEADPKVIASALNFGSFVGGWSGRGDPPAELSRQCGCVVERSHALNRKVRLFGGPDTPDSWVFQLDHGVDFINADDLLGLKDILDAR